MAQAETAPEPTPLTCTQCGESTPILAINAQDLYERVRLCATCLLAGRKLKDVDTSGYRFIGGDLQNPVKLSDDDAAKLLRKAAKSDSAPAPETPLQAPEETAQTPQSAPTSPQPPPDPQDHPQALVADVAAAVPVA